MRNQPTKASHASSPGDSPARNSSHNVHLHVIKRQRSVRMLKGKNVGSSKLQYEIRLQFAHVRHYVMHATAQAFMHNATAPACHICIVSETYAPEVNGVALTVARFVRGLRAQGYTVSVVRPRQQTEKSHNHVVDWAETTVRGMPLPGYQGLQFGLPAGRVLQHAWEHNRPDVIYIATEGPLGWSALGAAQRLAIPVLSGFHTNFHSYSQYYRAGLLQPVIMRYLRAFHNRTQGTLVPSRDLRDRLLTLGFHNVSILGRGVDTELFTPARRCMTTRQQWGVSAQEMVALYVGRVAAEKNLSLAVAAYRAMQQHTPRLKFVIVGDGPLRATLQHNHPDIIFPGVCTGEQLAQQYASADLFLFPSETETFGNVTLEAMASGLAVIAYDYAAARMHIVHGHSGILVPYGDRQAFITAATDLMQASHLQQQLRQQARMYATHVGWDQIIERFASLLHAVQAQSLGSTQALTPHSQMTA